MAVNIAPAKGIGSTGITFYLGFPVQVNKMAIEKRVFKNSFTARFLSRGNEISAPGVSKYKC